MIEPASRDAAFGFGVTFYYAVFRGRLEFTGTSRPQWREAFEARQGVMKMKEAAKISLIQRHEGSGALAHNTGLIAF